MVVRLFTVPLPLQVKSLERSVYKVRGWLKTRGEDMIVTQCDIGTSVDSVQAVLEHHEKCEAKARVRRGIPFPLHHQHSLRGFPSDYITMGLPLKLSHTDINTHPLSHNSCSTTC